ncbi:MAG: MarR family transcriptional regulator [Lachnospiraceae bacterium]
MENTKELFLLQQTYATLFSVANKLQVKSDKALELLTNRQLMTMIAIIHLPKGEASLNRIARKMGTTKQNTKQLVDALKKKGFVKVVLSETDKRAYSIEINEERQNDFVECFLRGNQFLEEIFKGFTKAELEVMWNMLKRLHCFDGEVQDGFEEAVDFGMT